MKRLYLSVVGAGLLAGCGSPVDSIDRSDVDCWNGVGVWRCVAGTTHDYVPSDFKGKPSGNPAAGEWLVDPQDGWRFYIPNDGTRNYPAGVLRGEVTKSLNAFTKGQQGLHNLVTGVYTVPARAAGAPFKAIIMASGLHPVSGGESRSRESERSSESHRSESKSSSSSSSSKDSDSSKTK